MKYRFGRLSEHALRFPAAGIARRLDDSIPNLAFCSSLFSTRQSAVQNDSEEEAVNSLRAEIWGLPITAHVDGQSLA